MHDNDLPFEDLSPEEDEELSPEELEALNDPNPEYFTLEDAIAEFVEHFGYEPHIKNPNDFMFYVLSGFDDALRGESLEVERDRRSMDR
jgi:hypothetical protein